MSLLPASLLALSTGLVAAPAHARRPEVAVVGVHVAAVDESAAEAVVLDLEKSIEKAAKVDVLELGQVRSRLAGREPLVLEEAFLGPGRARLDEGRVLYERAEFDAAVPVLREAVHALEDGSLGTTHVKDLLDALLLVGLAEFGRGDEAKADETFARFVVLDPTRRLDTVNHPPKVVARFDEVRARVLAADKAVLKAEVPDASQLFVDGRKVDAGALSLPPGEHFVVLQAADGRRQADRVFLSAGDTAFWSAADASRRLSSPVDDPDGRSDQTALLYAALGAHLDADLVLLGGVDADGGLALQLYEPRTGNFSKTVSGEAGADPAGELGELVPVLAGYLGDDGVLRPDRVSRNIASLDISSNALLTRLLLDPQPLTVTEIERRGPPWYVWAGVAAVAAGGAAGLAVALSGDDGGGGTTTTTTEGETVTTTETKGSVVLTVP